MKQAAGTPNICDTPIRPEAEQRAFFDDVMALAMLADERARCGEVFISVAGACVRLLFSGAALLRDFMPALAHLQTGPAARPDAVWYIWDSQSTGIAMRPAPCAWDCLTDRGDIWSFESRRFRSAFHWSDFSLNLLDMATGVGTYWVQSAEDLVYWTKASPFRTLFGWLMAQRGCQLLHAAAVGTEAGAVLIAGKGGAGKSTTALSCLAAGMKYLADDYLVAQLAPEPRVFSLYATAKLQVAQLRHFPALRGLLATQQIAADEKAVLNLWPAEALAGSLPLLAALTPRFAAVPGTGFRPAAPELLIHSAAFTTMSQLPHAGRATHEFIHRLMHRLPCYEILLGEDIGAIPAAVRRFLADAGNLSGAGATDAATAGPGDRPFISVIIPVYNGAGFLRESVASVVAQHYSPLEIIVVDDGSEEDVEAAVRALNVDVRLFRQDNAGPAAARNLGIRNAAGELLAFLDVDDLWPPGMLAGLAGHLNAHAELDIVHGYGQLMRSDADGEPEFIGSARETFPYYLAAALYRRRAFETVGLFDTELRFGEDTDWFTRAGEKGLRVERLEQVTLHIRRHGGNMTRDKNLRELGTLRIFKKLLDRRRQEQAGPA